MEREISKLGPRTNENAKSMRGETMNTTSIGIGTIESKIAGWSIALSILMIVLGIFAIVIPPVAGVGVAIVVGWLFVLSAAAHLVFAWHVRSAGGFIWELVVGAFYLFVGTYVLLHPVAGLASLTLVLALYLFVEGILEFILSFQLRPTPGAKWLLLDGVITLILAVMIWATWPANTEWVIGTLVGISMLFSGISRLGLSMTARRTAAKTV
jgi:uncharacterized membrane protein HdeD (DUF308 family)